MTGTYTATLDRIVEEKTAVLLLEEEEETIEQLDVEITKLPSAGQHEGAVFEATVEGGELCGIEYLPDVTQSRKEAAQERLDRLSTKLSDRKESETDN